jgi:hypothetical protein
MEAIAHLRSGLECVQALLPGASRSRFELSLQLALGGPLIATKGFASSEAEAAYQRAQELSRELQSETDLFAADRRRQGRLDANDGSHDPVGSALG